MGEFAPTQELTQAVLPASPAFLAYRLQTPEQLQERNDAYDRVAPSLSPLLRALIVPAWKGSGPAGEEGGRPNIAALCAAEEGGLPPEVTVDGSVYSIARL